MAPAEKTKKRGNLTSVGARMAGDYSFATGHSENMFNGLRLSDEIEPTVSPLNPCISPNIGQDVVIVSGTSLWHQKIKRGAFQNACSAPAHSFAKCFRWE
jgi:hypothetical protein